MLKLIKKLFFILLMLILIFSVCICISITATLPDINDFEYSSSQKSTLVTEEGETIAEIFDENRSFVSIKKIPDNLKNAVVAVEDKRFYKHSGVDIIGIIRAIFANLKSGEISEGGSTITQQVVKRIFLTDEQTFTRKVKEALLALKFERKFSKDEILEIYLNDIYLGEGTYGVEEASLYYFGKHVSEINLGEAALLAGLPQAPSVYAPVTDEGYKLAKNRQKKILKLMLEQDYITSEEYDKTVNEDVKILSNNLFYISSARFGYNAYSKRVIEDAKNILIEEYKKQGLSEEKSIKNADVLIYQEGIEIICSLNIDLQESALESTTNTLKEYTSDDNVTVSFVSIDSSNGRVVAYYGGNTEIDMADSSRQPGSTIKPLYIAKAIDSDLITKDTFILDEKVTINNYSPKNSSNKYYGYVPVSEIVARSLNSGSVRIFEQMGVEAGVDAVKSFGISTITSDDYNYAFSLGGLTYGFKPLEMASAYSVFANDGKRCEPYFVKAIKNSNGEYIYKRENIYAESVINSDANNQMIRCLKNVVLFGTGKSADNIYETYGKTGTTSNNKDYWFCGITGNMATAIWIGRPDNQSISSGSSAWSAKCYSNYIKNCSSNSVTLINANKKSEEGYKKIYIVKPNEQSKFGNYFTIDQINEITVANEDAAGFNEVKGVNVDITTGLLFNKGNCPDKFKETRYYLTGEVPTEECTSWHVLSNIFNGEDKSDESTTNRRKNGLFDW